MDANGQRFWMLSEPGHWALAGAHAVSADHARKVLTLRSERSGHESFAEELTAAEAALARVADARDRFGTRARLDGARIVASGAGAGEEPIYEAPGGASIEDFLVGFDDVLYVAASGAVVLRSLLDAWDAVELSAADFHASKLAADPDGGVWALDTTSQRVARVRGLPLPRRPHGPYADDVFRPDPEDPEPPTLRAIECDDFDADERPVALAVSPAGRLFALCWSTGLSRVRQLLPRDGGRHVFGPALTLEGARHPYALGFIDEDQLAVLVTQGSGFQEAPTYRLPRAADQQQRLPIQGEIFPLVDHDGRPFLRAPQTPPLYGTAGGDARALVRLSLPSRARAGSIDNALPLDGERQGTVWHRIYLEGVIPAGCGVRLLLSATDEPVRPRPPDEDPDAWHEHLFGVTNATDAEQRPAPRGIWCPQPSELPFHDGLLDCAAEPHRTGLFTVLVQRSQRRVSDLAGRYLWVRAELEGDGRDTPELRAVRIYGSRFSYVDNYLPLLYRESELGPDADRRSAEASPADFLQRFLSNVEGVLTPLEDRIAQADVLTDPRGTPEEALPWLASWIGLSLDPGWPEDRRRAAIAASSELRRWHGTERGLKLALDVLTGGAVASGEIVVVEDFRLRRTLATILGADLVRRDDEMLAGLDVSGNSYVGDTLFLGSEEQKELLALYDAGLELSEAEREAVDAFFERFAHRVSVLVRRELGPDRVDLVRRVVELEAPAHVQARVLRASSPLVVGLSSLVGIDTYLGETPNFGGVRLGESRLGVDDMLRRPPSLDPRLEGDA